MAKEIERRFLVDNVSVLQGQSGQPILQGYLAREAMTVRVRILGDEAFIAIKGRRCGLTRDEFEYPIPLADASALLHTHCASGLIRKVRYRIPHGRHVFEVDVFQGRLAGLVVAEVELEDESEEVELPPWLGREITYARGFGNFTLARGESPPGLSCPGTAWTDAAVRSPTS